MTYWNSLGLNGSPANANVETAAKWVQWAMYGVADRSKEQEVRYNLRKFWDFKNYAYYKESDLARVQYDKLDSIANGVLYSLETRYAVEGKSGASSAAETARLAAAAAATRAGGAWKTDMGSLFSSRMPTGADLDRIAEDYKGMPKPAGIPWTAIGIAAGILALAFVLRD